MESGERRVASRELVAEMSCGGVGEPDRNWVWASSPRYEFATMMGWRRRREERLPLEIRGFVAVVVVVVVPAVVVVVDAPFSLVE